MALSHHVEINGQDVSPWVESIRADENLNYNEGDKIDITLIHINNMFLGSFLTKHEVKATLYNEMVSCSGRSRLEFVLADGEVQKVSYQPNRVLVEAVCHVGTFSDALIKDYDARMKTISQVVNDLLDMHRDQGRDGDKIKGRVIEITSDSAFDYQWPVFKAGQVSYQTALTHLATKAGAIWYVDELGIFYFVDPIPQKGTINLDPYMMNPDDAASVIGHVNIIRVVGTGVFPPSSEYSPLETHERYFEERRNEESIEEHGELVAPVLYAPNLSTRALVEERAENLKEYFKVAENVARPRLVGFVPPIMSFVHYHAGVTNYSGCERRQAHGILSHEVDGLCVRRIVEYSKRGLLCEVEVATSVPEAGLAYIRGDESAVIIRRREGDPDEIDEEFIQAVAQMEDDEVPRVAELVVSDFEEEGAAPDPDEPVDLDSVLDGVEPIEVEVEGMWYQAAVVVGEDGRDYLLVPPPVALALYDQARGDRDRFVGYPAVAAGAQALLYNVNTGEAGVAAMHRQGLHRVVPWNDPSSTSVRGNLAGGWPDYG